MNSIDDIRRVRTAFDSPNSAVGKIVQGALRAIGRQGTKQLSVGVICEAANVSRGTFYRYFSTKEDVLQAVSEYVSYGYIEGVREAAAQSTEPMEIFRSVLNFSAEFSRNEHAHRIFQIEPEFVVRFLNAHFEDHVAALQTALDPVFIFLERKHGRKLDRRVIAEALIRLNHSTVLVPGSESWDRFPEVLLHLIASSAT